MNRLWNYFTKMARCGLFAALSACLLFATANLAAQTGQPQLQANVVSKNIAIGEIGTLVLKAVNGDPENLPDSIAAEGLTISSTAAPPTFTLNIVKGTRTTASDYLYQFKGDTAGTFTIPAVQTIIRGVPVASSPIEITVYKRTANSNSLDATKPIFGKFNLSKTEMWAKELVPFSITGYVRGRGAISDVVAAELNHESFVIQKFKNVKTDAVELSGNLYSLARLPSSLFALKPGEHTLGPAEIGIRVLDRSSGFGFPSIFQRTQTHNVSTNSLTITVKPLPPGAPASFTGGVGNFEIAVSPSATSVAIGDPISLNMSITGVGNFNTIGTPVFDAASAGEWRTYDANRTIDAESDGESQGRATISQVVIPLEKATQIPGLEFSYFNPVSGEYVTKSTPAIPITVSAEGGNRALPGGAPLSSGANSSSGTFPAALGAEKPEAQFNDILHIRTGPTEWVPALANTGVGFPFYAIQFIFSLGFFTILALGTARIVQTKKKEKAAAHVGPTFKQAVRAIPKTGATRREFYQGVDRALEIWKSEHGDATEKVIDAIDHLAGKCQSYLYSGNDQPDEPVSDAEREEFQSILVKLSHK